MPFRHGRNQASGSRVNRSIARRSCLVGRPLPGSRRATAGSAGCGPDAGWDGAMRSPSWLTILPGTHYNILTAHALPQTVTQFTAIA